MNDAQASPPIVVVLGAPNDANGRLSPVAEARARTALRTYRADPSCRLLLTGGQGAHFNTAPRPHFEYVAALLHEQGLPADAIIGCVPSRNTIEDARLSAERLADAPALLVLKVVTSDFHIARARLLFERAFPAERATIDMVAAPSMLSPDDLAAALDYEAKAIRRLLSSRKS